MTGGRRSLTGDRARLTRAALTLAGAGLLFFAPLVAQPLDRYTTFKNMLGRPGTQSSVRTVIRQLGAYTVEKLEARDAEYYFSFAARGVELHFDAKHRIDFAVLINGEAFREYKSYAGSLPEKLTFADDEATVLKKLGQPDRTAQVAVPGGEQERALLFKSKGYSVVFKVEGPKRSRMKYVEIFKPERG